MKRKGTQVGATPTGMVGLTIGGNAGEGELILRREKKEDKGGYITRV